jgi:hypothetical protein
LIQQVSGVRTLRILVQQIFITTDGLPVYLPGCHLQLCGIIPGGVGRQLHVCRLLDQQVGKPTGDPVTLGPLRVMLEVVMIGSDGLFPAHTCRNAGLILRRCLGHH